MTERVKEELALLGRRFTGVELVDQGAWVRVPSFPTVRPEWNRQATAVAFQVPPGFPGARPYGFYVPAGLLFAGVKPSNYTVPAQNAPPFPGVWGFFSWQPEDGEWRPAATVTQGSNLLHWVLGFVERFRQGV